MRILRPIVCSPALLMVAGKPEMPKGSAVGAQLVSYQQFWRKPLLCEKLADQPQRLPAVAATLGQHVEDLAFVVNDTPEVHPLAGDPNNQASGAGQLHRRALSEPDVILSHHPAPIVRPKPAPDGRLRGAYPHLLCSSALPLLVVRSRRTRPNASDRSAEGDAGAAVARSRGRTSAPNAAPFRRRCRALVRPAVPRHRGSSG